MTLLSTKLLDNSSTGARPRVRLDAGGPAQILSLRCLKLLVHTLDVQL